MCDVLRATCDVPRPFAAVPCWPPLPAPWPLWLLHRRHRILPHRLPTPMALPMWTIIARPDGDQVILSWQTRSETKKGYDVHDNVAGTLACIFAVGTALFPTHRTATDTDLSGTLHFVFAALFFLTLIYFALFLFTKTNPNIPPTPRKRLRNIVYRICGYTMVVCILLIVVVFQLPEAHPLNVYHPVFWLEARAVVAFGFSWITKGEALLKDDV